MKDDRLYVVYALECVERIERYAGGGRAGFLESELVQDAILRNLHTLAGATQRMSADLRRRHPEIPWRDLAGLRNVVVHN